MISPQGTGNPRHDRPPAHRWCPSPPRRLCPILHCERLPLCLSMGACQLYEFLKKSIWNFNPKQTRKHCRGMIWKSSSFLQCLPFCKPLERITVVETKFPNTFRLRGCCENNIVSLLKTHIYFHLRKTWVGNNVFVTMFSWWLLTLAFIAHFKTAFHSHVIITHVFVQINLIQFNWLWCFRNNHTNECVLEVCTGSVYWKAVLK
jgi:hypothetical protein